MTGWVGICSFRRKAQETVGHVAHIAFCAEPRGHTQVGRVGERAGVVPSQRGADVELLEVESDSWRYWAVPSGCAQDALGDHGMDFLTSADIGGASDSTFAVEHLNLHEPDGFSAISCFVHLAVGFLHDLCKHNPSARQIRIRFRSVYYSRRTYGSTPASLATDFISSRIWETVSGELPILSVAWLMSCNS